MPNQKSKVGFIGYLVMVIQATFSLLMTPFKIAFVFLLSTLLPVRTKRVMFLSTLYTLLFSDTSNEMEEALHRINEQFRLVDNERAMELPILLRRVIWNEEQVEQCVSEQCDILEPTRMPNEAQLRAASERVLALTPKWLRYGRRDDMIGDVLSVLTAGRIANRKTV